MRYQAKLTKSEEGVAVSCPGLLGCWAQVKRRRFGKHSGCYCGLFFSS